MGLQDLKIAAQLFNVLQKLATLLARSEARVVDFMNQSMHIILLVYGITMRNEDRSTFTSSPLRTPQDAPGCR